MKITVVGAILVFAVVVIILILIHALTEGRNPNQKESDPVDSLLTR